jgi:hypothetical protein
MNAQLRLEKPVTTPIHIFEHPDLENQIDLIGMIHIGELGYYREVQGRADTAHADGSVVHFEKVRTSTPEQVAAENKTTQQKVKSIEATYRSVYRIFDLLDLNLTKQLDGLTYRDTWQNHDASDIDIARRLGKFTVWRQNLALDTIVDSYRAMNASDRREKLLPLFYKILADGGVKDRDVKSKIIGWILLGNTDGVILDYRNDVALKALDQQQRTTPGANMVLLWGAGHIAGLGKGLQKRGYKKVEEEKLIAIGRQ